MTLYADLELYQLIDLLIIHTDEYTEMLSSRVFSVEDFTQCKQKLAEIHAAIKQKSIDEGLPMDNIMPNFPGDDSIYFRTTI
jgi:hypothetical protein